MRDPMLARFLFATVSSIVLPSSSHALPTGPYFMGLGSLTERARDISDDGSTIVGSGFLVQYGSYAFRWTEESGVVILPQLIPGGRTRAWAVSGDGSVVVGEGRAVNGKEEAFLWTAATGTIGLGVPGGDTTYGSMARDVSADGSRVLVWKSQLTAHRESFVWTQESGFEPIAVQDGVALGMSDDGTRIVGIAPVHDATGYLGGEAFLWSEDGGFLGLGDLPGDELLGAGQDVSSDGSVVVGNGRVPSSIPQAFRWSEDTGMVPITLPGSSGDGSALGVSNDGTIVVGWVSADAGGVAFVWDEANGTRALKDVLLQAGLDLAGWELSEAVAISGDGRRIVGNGINPQGKSEAWLAIIPEPSTALLLATGLLGLATARRHMRWSP